MVYLFASGKKVFQWFTVWKKVQSGHIARTSTYEGRHVSTDNDLVSFNTVKSLRSAKSDHMLYYSSKFHLTSEQNLSS